MVRWIIVATLCCSPWISAQAAPACKHQIAALQHKANTLKASRPADWRMRGNEMQRLLDEARQAELKHNNQACLAKVKEARDQIPN